MRAARVSLVLLLSVITLARVAIAQNVRPFASVVAELRTLDGAVQVHYPAGSEEYAAYVQRVLAEAKPFFEAKTGAPLSFTVALLGPTEFLAINPPDATYANFLPSVNRTPPAVMTLPAVRGHALDILYTRLWAPSEPPDINRLTAMVGLHELGHLVATQMNISSNSPWFLEFLANYIAHVYLLEKHPDDALLANAASAALKDRIHPSLTALDQMGFGAGPDNYVWYQASLQQRVSEIASTKGWAFVEAAKALRAKDDAGLLTELEALAPGFLAWAARNHGHATSK